MSCLAVLFLIYRQSLPVVVRDSLFTITVVAFIGAKLLFFLRGVDILLHPEKHVCYVLFGGLVDDVHAWSTERDEPPTTSSGHK